MYYMQLAVVTVLASCQADHSCRVYAWNTYEYNPTQVDLVEVRAATGEDGDFGPNLLEQPLAYTERSEDNQDAWQMDLGHTVWKVIYADGAEVEDDLYCDVGESWSVAIPIRSDSSATQSAITEDAALNPEP
jgi:hypothetical protein